MVSSSAQTVSSCLSQLLTAAGCFEILWLWVGHIKCYQTFTSHLYRPLVPSQRCNNLDPTPHITALFTQTESLLFTVKAAKKWHIGIRRATSMMAMFHACSQTAQHKCSVLCLNWNTSLPCSTNIKYAPVYFQYYVSGREWWRVFRTYSRQVASHFSRTDMLIGRIRHQWLLKLWFSWLQYERQFPLLLLLSLPCSPSCADEDASISQDGVRTFSYIHVSALPD